jgi:hypothetical protein
MSYRYNTFDIIVGVGMTAIVFGALLFFMATTGTFQTGSAEFASLEELSHDPTGMIWLQPALGQAVVDQALLERRTNRSVAEAASLWNRATMASHDLQSAPGGPFGYVMQAATTVPAQHLARVQGVMGRSIVNFTQRGIRSGVFPVGPRAAAYNADMISKTEAMGMRLEEAFASTWQATLGRAIVETSQQYTQRIGAIQEQLGAAVLQVTHSQVVTEEERAANQQQLASLVAAAIRTDALSDRVQLLAAIEFPEESAVASAKPASLPAIPIGYLIAALVGLGAIFFTGLIASAMSRAAKAQAEMQRDTSRWVYRLAA